MAGKMRAVLLQSGQGSHAVSLQEGLRAQAVEFSVAKNCAEIRPLLASPNPPELILTDLEFPDGTWEDALRLGQNASLPVNVIVVSRLAEIRLYMEVLQKGAFDFITPPFEAPELAHVIQTAFENASRKRKAQPLPALQSSAQAVQPCLALAG